MQTVILCALSYLRNKVFSPDQSFPICQKMGKKNPNKINCFLIGSQRVEYDVAVQNFTDQLFISLHPV